MIAALLCGLFYGSLLLDAWKKEAERRRLARLLADLQEYWDENDDCECEECCGCGESVDLTRGNTTGYVPAGSVWPDPRELAKLEKSDCEERDLAPESLAALGEAEPVAYHVFPAGISLPCTCETDGGQCWAVHHKLPAEHGACDCKTKRPFPGEVGPSISVGA